MGLASRLIKLGAGGLLECVLRNHNKLILETVNEQSFRSSVCSKWVFALWMCCFLEAVSGHGLVVPRACRSIQILNSLAEEQSTFPTQVHGCTSLVRTLKTARDLFA